MSCEQFNNECVVNICSGDRGRISGSALSDVWERYDCIGAYSTKINTKDNILEYNEDEQKDAQIDVRRLFENYLSTNIITDDITSPGYSTFQDTLRNLCIDNSVPGICADFLENYCPTMTREEITNSPVQTQFCGCYTPPDPKYLTYTMNPSCDPLCHKSTTSKRADPKTGVIEECPENVCVISDVQINAAELENPEGINFTSVCGGCAGIDNDGPGCICIISGVSVSNTMGSIGVGSNIQQFCGGNSVCITEDADGNVISEGGCNQNDFKRVATVSVSKFEPPLGIVITFVVVVLISMLLLFQK